MRACAHVLMYCCNGVNGVFVLGNAHIHIMHVCMWCCVVVLVNADRQTMSLMTSSWTMKTSTSKLALNQGLPCIKARLQNTTSHQSPNPWWTQLITKAPILDEYYNTRTEQGTEEPFNPAKWRSCGQTSPVKRVWWFQAHFTQLNLHASSLHTPPQVRERLAGTTLG